MSVNIAYDDLIYTLVLYKCELEKVNKRIELFKQDKEKNEQIYRNYIDEKKQLEKLINSFHKVLNG